MPKKSIFTTQSSSIYQPPSAPVYPKGGRQSKSTLIDNLMDDIFKKVELKGYKLNEDTRLSISTSLNTILNQMHNEEITTKKTELSQDIAESLLKNKTFKIFSKKFEISQDGLFKVSQTAAGKLKDIEIDQPSIRPITVSKSAGPSKEEIARLSAENKSTFENLYKGEEDVIKNHNANLEKIKADKKLVSPIAISSIKNLKKNNFKVDSRMEEKIIKSLNETFKDLDPKFLACNIDELTTKVSKQLIDDRSFSAKFTKNFTISTEKLNNIVMETKELQKQWLSKNSVTEIQEYKPIIPKGFDNFEDFKRHVEGMNKPKQPKELPPPPSFSPIARTTIIKGDKLPKDMRRIGNPEITGFSQKDINELREAASRVPPPMHTSTLSTNTKTKSAKKFGQSLDSGR